MPEKAAISESEWKLMEVLWQMPGQTLSQVAGALEATGWSYSTIKTLLSRLAVKGYVTTKREARNYLYSAAVAESVCKAEEAKGFLGRVFGGSVSALVSNLAKESALTEAERKELSDLIERMDDRQGTKGPAKGRKEPRDG